MTPNHSDISLWRAENILFIKLKYTDFDATSSHEFKILFESLVLKHTLEVIILDLSNLALMDGAGVATLINLWTLSNKRNIKLMLCSAQKNVKQLLEQKKVQSLLEIYSSSQEAIQMARQSIEFENLAKNKFNAFKNIFGFDTEETQGSVSLVSDIHDKMDYLQSAS